jgi:hypothetical protein
VTKKNGHSSIERWLSCVKLPEGKDLAKADVRRVDALV